MSLFKKDEHIKNVSMKAGISYSAAKEMMNRAKEIGIGYAEFDKNNCHNMSHDELIDMRQDRKIRQLIKDSRIEYVMRQTGWSYDEADKALNEAKKQRKIQNSAYVKYGLYNVAPEEQEEYLKKCLESKPPKKDKRDEGHKDKYVEAVANATGWTREHAREMMQECKDRCGMSFEHYSTFSFWNIEEEIQNQCYTREVMFDLQDKYNKDGYTNTIMRDKVLFNSLFDAYLGRPWMSNQWMDFSEFKNKFLPVGKIIYKPASSSGGNHIKVFDIDETTVKVAFDEISTLPKGIVEGFLKQHPEMQKVSKKSVNTIRVVTIRTKDPNAGIETRKVHIVYMGIRMGAGDSYADNLHSGGMIAAVDKDTGEVVTDAINFKTDVYEYHPDTGVKIKGFQIPMFEELRALVEAAASEVYGCYGWDIAITESGPVVIECNTKPGSGILQGPYIPLKKGMKYVVEPYL